MARPKRGRRKFNLTLTPNAIEKLRASADHYNTTMGDIVEDLIEGELEDWREPKDETASDRASVQQ